MGTYTLIDTVSKFYDKYDKGPIVRFVIVLILGPTLFAVIGDAYVSKQYQFLGSVEVPYDLYVLQNIYFGFKISFKSAILVGVLIFLLAPCIQYAQYISHKNGYSLAIARAEIESLHFYTLQFPTLVICQHA